MGAVSVLLIEQNSTFLHIITSLLEEYYHEHITVVASSSGGSDAIRKARTHGLHIILLGTGQSTLSDLQIIPHLRRAAPQAGIIVLGLLDIPVYQQTALDTGADAFVSKASVNSNLLSEIQRIAAQKQVDNYTPDVPDSTIATDGTGVYDDTPYHTRRYL